ncbi:hypothetical protein IT570_09425 [Candidatus Sumerlaeota bacterium]|nr:hypothetical protein [Candidatus Sumerlaeota bacterium]
MSRKILQTAFILSTLSLLACDDQQILYKTKSKEVIPPVSQVTSAVASADPHAALASAAGPGAAMQHVDYAKLALKEEGAPHQWAGIGFNIPTRYHVGEPAAMRIAQFGVSARSGDGMGEFVVFYFGRGQGGSVEDNVGRWVRQFAPAAGKTTPVTRYEHGHVGNLEVTRVTMEGTYSAGAMAPGGAKPGAQEDWALDAFIVEGGPEGSLYIRLTGPDALVRGEKETIDGIIASAGSAGSGAKQPPAPAAAVPSGGDASLPLVNAPGILFAVPSDWERAEVASSMRAAQYQIPGGSEFVLFYFGPSGGGTVSDNFNRWVAQVKQPDGSDTRGRMKTETKTIGDITVNTLYMEGTYTATAMGPNAPKPESKAGQGFLGFIVEGGSKGALYGRITGPAENVRTLIPTLDNIIIPSLKKVP